MISEETKEKIRQVASVCIRCRRCMTECMMLNRFAQNPRELFTQYLELGPENMDRHIAYSCNECSQCTLKCPKDLNLKAVFQSLKADYAAENKGIVPVAALLPSEIGQVRECSSDYCTALTAGTGSDASHPAKYLFVPGQFPAEPIVAHLRSCLGQSNVDLFPAQVLDRITPDLLQELNLHPNQILITACPSSFSSLRQAVPHRRILFYWDLMHDIIGMPRENAGIRDSLLLHTGDGLEDSVRWVLDKLGCQWTQAGDQPDLLTADQDCRQILGLLFGLQEADKA